MLRHRLVLSYEALSDGVTADQVLDRVLAAVEPDLADRGPEADTQPLRSPEGLAA